MTHEMGPWRTGLTYLLVNCIGSNVSDLRELATSTAAKKSDFIKLATRIIYLLESEETKIELQRGPNGNLHTAHAACRMGEHWSD